MAGNSESCPQCGRPSPLLEGTFDFDRQGNAEFVRGPELTRKVYEQFKSLVQVAQHEELDQNEFLRRTKDISPQFASKVSDYIQNSNISHQDRIGYLTLLMTLLTVISGYFKEDEKVPTYNINNYYDGATRDSSSYTKKFTPSPKKPEVKPVEPTVEKPVVVKKAKKKKNRVEEQLQEETIVIRTDSTKQIITRIVKRRR